VVGFDTLPYDGGQSATSLGPWAHEFGVNPNLTFEVA
jgi:hypothetical protein